MKKNIFKIASLLALVSFTMTSCDEWLTVYPQTQIVEENFWEDKNDLEGVRYAAYKNMASQVDKMIIWGDLRSDIYKLPEVPSSSLGNRDNFEKIIYAEIDTTWTYYDWSGMYSTIGYCNKVLQHGEEILEKDKQFTKAEWNQMKAEMVTMRALSYFYLVRAFKSIPYTTKVVNSDRDKEYFPQLPVLDVMDSLITDVEKVVGQARNRSIKAQETKGQITNAAIHALLCDMYLWRASIRDGRDGQNFMSEETINDYKQCIHHSEMSLKKLQEQFDEERKSLGVSFSANDFISWTNDKIYDGEPINFMYKNIIDDARNGNLRLTAYNEIFGRGNSHESIFELQFSSTDGRSNGAVNSMFGSSSGSHLVSSLSVDDDHDLRFLFSAWSDVGENSLGDAYCLKWMKATPEIDRSTQGTSAPKITMDAEQENYNNWIVYRLSDILLNNAEARACLMTFNQDVDANRTVCRRILRMINRRWWVDYQNSKDVDTDLDTKISYDKDNDSDDGNQYYKHVMNTRKMEFVGEGKRWFDLVRYAERNSESDDDATGMYKMFEDFPYSIRGSEVIPTRCENLWGLYSPIYYMECKAYRAGKANITQNPVWNKSKYDR